MSGIGEMLQNDVAGALGNIEKAALIFLEPPSEPPQRHEVDARTSGAPLLDAGMVRAGSGGFLNTMKNKLGAVTDAGKKFLKITDSKDALAAYQEYAREKGWQTDGRAFQLQFNPSSIRLSARGGGRMELKNYNTAAGSGQNNNQTVGDIHMGGVKPYMTVSFRIIFDSENNADAFARDKFSASATNLVKGGTTLVRSLMGNEFTVRPFVEGFLAAMRVRVRKKVVFQWGKMRYLGELSSVAGNYTMFSLSGNPIRAEVDVEITSANDENGGTDYLDVWQSRYREILSGKEDGFSAGTIKNQMTSLINL